MGEELNEFNPLTRAQKYVLKTQQTIGYTDWADAYNALKAVLAAIEDPYAIKSKKSFLTKVDTQLESQCYTEKIVSNVFLVLAEYIEKGEIVDFTPNLSSELKVLWPKETYKGGLPA
ncbi:MAG: hypothetical protein GF334_13910 [Candidatus Altiarchaeales archaeon]|nr:hypothetical protein [Candidatus Altiarchaeales archaeon]